MANEQPVYRPRELYERQLKNQYHKGAEDFFEELGAKAGINKALNEQHVKAYEAAKAELEAAKKKLGGAKAGKGWSIAGIVVSFLAAIVFLVIGILNGAFWGYIVFAVGLILGVLFIVLLVTKVKHALAAAKALVAEKEAKAKEALDVCYKDMAAVNDLLDDSMPGQVMEKTTPIIDLDPVFSPERLCYLMDRFGMGEETDPNTSVLGVLSGHISGNPFVLEKVFRHEVKDKTYEGTLTITWTTTHRDSKGNTYTQTHTQTLHAETVHPAPFYWKETRLIYGSEVAPHLHFTRSPSGMSGKSEKDLAKYIKDRVKELDKLEEAAVKKGKTFTKLGNDEFDALFGADDRDHEVEFRVMYTPLAQRNMLDLIKNPTPYGDDFVMIKDGMLTSVASGHSQNFDYFVDSSYFRHYDFAEAKANFVSYCDAFIKGLFFDLAPIISVPLYQIHEPHDYIYDGHYQTNMTSFEHEAMINRMSKHLFMPDGADPDLPLVLKQANARKISGADEVGVHSLSYHTTPRVDYVSKLGGDGRWHDVPVHWTQYDAVNCTRNVGLVDSKKSRPQFLHASLEPLANYLKDNGFHFERGLLSFFLGEQAHLKSADADAFDKFFAKED